MRDVLIKMIENREKLQIVYDDELRIIEPNYLFRYDQGTYSSYYTIAYCHMRKAPRIFKMSRISSRRQLKVPWDYEAFSLEKVDLSRFELKRMTFIEYVEDHLKYLLLEGYKTFDQREKTSYPITIKLSKMIEAGSCRSPLEERVIHSYNKDAKVKSIKIEPFKIEYKFNNEIKQYIPDLLIEYHDNKKDLVEVKISSEIQELENQAKFGAALKYAKENDMKFLICGMDIQGSNYKSTGEYGWTARTNSHPLQSFATDYQFQRELKTFEYIPTKQNNNNSLLYLGSLAVLIVILVIWFV